ncbi:MAG: dTDP-4-dehydrorhamnose reductase [Flaviaesturariibacter sp.]|nr:dTDP-4-dehydrorhamnose reductase [Flaviaesturariibacter sp.]
MRSVKPVSNIEIWGGLECTINRVGETFFDQLEYNGFYRDPPLDTIAELGIKKLRFPILWERHQPEANTKINWDFTEQQLSVLKKKNIDVIAGLVHHGSGPAFTNLLDENFPQLLAEYAGKVAAKFPWINYYTPVNEPLTTARFSGLYGFWYPHAKDDRSFQLALLYQLKGVVLAMKEIRKVNPDAQLVQTEDLGKTYCTPLLKYQAKFENERRWLTYDILCGRLNEKHRLWKYFTKKNIPADLLQFFIDNPCQPDVFGFNHYVTSERFLDQDYRKYPKHLHGGNKRHKYVDIEAARVKMDEPYGIEVLLKEAWERYKRPIAVTEVHLHCHREEQIRWFKYVHEATISLAAEGVEILGVTAWALLGSYGWNKLLTEPKGEYEPGVFDLRGNTCRPTALASYIKSLTAEKRYNHTYYTGAKGWWERGIRFIHPPHLVQQEKVAAQQNKRPILIIGKRGTLGQAFGRLCEHRAIPHQLMSRQDCDIADLGSVQKAMELYKPWAIINAAGYVRVDDAEREVSQCFRENQLGPYNLALACQQKGVKLVSYSSDLVFDGKKDTPYVESDPVNPLNIYGKSKAQSESEILQVNPSALIIRTSAFFGPWDSYNFLSWVETSLQTGIPFPVASDILISPTYVPDLVNVTLDLLIDDEKGIWHLANEGSISWADLAKETARRLRQKKSLIKPTPAAAFNYPAPRPKYSVLGSERGALLPSLENAFTRYFAEKKHFAELPN